MNPTYIRDDCVRLSDCDSTGRLSLPALFDMFMDVATLHADDLGIGFDDLRPRQLFWLAVRTRIRVHRRSDLSAPIRIETWPEKGGKLRCYRNYRLFDGESPAAEGKTEWAVIDTGTGRLAPLLEAYPAGLMDVLRTDSVWSEPFARVREDFSDGEEWAGYTVRSTDIDVGGHMNNAAYPRMVLGAFSNAELRDMDIREMDFAYRNPCYEGDELRLCRRRIESGWELGAFNREGKTVLLGRIGGR